MTRKAWTRLCVVGVIVAMCAALTACGSSDSSSSSSGGDSATAASGSSAAAKNTAKPWSYPAQFVDCSASTSDPKGCGGDAIDGTYDAIAGSAITKPWRVCVSFPDLQDSYWLATNYGIVEEAKRDGLKMDLFDAGGYTNQTKQLSQIDNCVAGGTDAVVAGAISFDGLNAKVDELAGENIPMVDIMNGISNPKVQAHSVVSFYELGKQVGGYMAGLKKPLNVVFLPGPAGAGWVTDTVKGFNEAIKGSQVKVLATKFGDTAKDVQLNLVENAINTFPKIDYIVGSAVTGQAAVNSLKDHGLDGKVKLVTTYMVPETYDQLKAGQVECAATDQPVMQARMGIDEAVRLLEKKPLVGNYKRAAPKVQLFCGPASAQDNLKDFDPETTFAPTGYKPVFSTK
jgi:protein TorT